MHKPSMGGANKAMVVIVVISPVCSRVKLPKKIQVRLTEFCWGVYISIRLREGNRAKTWFYDSSVWQAVASLQGPILQAAAPEEESPAPPLRVSKEERPPVSLNVLMKSLALLIALFFSP